MLLIWLDKAEVVKGFTFSTSIKEILLFLQYKGFAFFLLVELGTSDFV